MPTLFASRTIDDPRDVKVVRALQAVGAGRSTVQLPAMSSSFREELRAQLVAVTPRLVAEGVRPGTETAPRPAASKARRAADRPAGRVATHARPRTRPMTVLVAGAAVVILGLGGATWLARNALPGDALYGLKRTAEGVDLSFTGSDVDKGHQLLVGAQTRVAEVDSLITRPQSMAFGTATSSAAGALSDGTVKLVVSTLATADTATQQGVTLIGDDAVRTGNQAGLKLVAGWAGGDDGKGGQIGRIQSLVDRIPSTPAHAAAQASLDNIDAAYQRAKDLLADVTAGRTCTHHDRDVFGPKPCAAVAPPAVPSVAPSAPSTGTTDTNPGSSAPSTTPTTGGASGPAPSTPSSTPSPSGTRVGGAKPGASSSPTPILTVGTCGVVVAGISLGPCTSSR